MTKPKDTYRVAVATGDRTFLEFITDRLVNVYGENEHTDFVITMKRFATEINTLAKKANAYDDMKRFIKEWDGDEAF